MTAAEVLSEAIRRGLQSATRRQEYLAEHPVHFLDDGIMHRVFDYARGPATWVCVCGVAYGGHAYVEAAEPGPLSCLLAIGHA